MYENAKAYKNKCEISRLNAVHAAHADEQIRPVLHPEAAHHQPLTLKGSRLGVADALVARGTGGRRHGLVRGDRARLVAAVRLVARRKVVREVARAARAGGGRGRRIARRKGDAERAAKLDKQIVVAADGYM